jgi:hypothetical protein
MWTYKQSTGEMAHNGTPVATGYSGGYNGQTKYKNAPQFEDVPDLGPLPRGSYTIGPPQNNPKLGPFAMPLTPAPTNEMFGRSAFFIHGDSLISPGNASEGCIIMPRAVREQIHASGDNQLTVVE